MGLSAERLDHWTLVTSDLARTQQFYNEVLDAEPLDRASPAAVNFGGTTIDFFLESDQQHPSPGSDHHAYAIALQDFDAWAEQLRKHGVSVSFANFGRTRMSMLFEPAAVNDTSSFSTNWTAFTETIVESVSMPFTSDAVNVN